MFIKTLNFASNAILPILIWQSYWLNNVYTNNVLNFLVWFIFILGLTGVVYVYNATKAELNKLKVSRDKNRFNNIYLDFITYCIEISCVIALIAFGSFINGFLLIISLLCIESYNKQLDTV